MTHEHESDEVLEGDLPDLSGTDDGSEREEIAHSTEQVNAGASTSASTQDLINQRILAQLNAIGSRLEKLESKQMVKKTSDPKKVKKLANTKTKQKNPVSNTDHG